jgi:hypothetical protein
MKKWLELSGTISGTTYFLRNLIASILAFTGGYILGTGLAAQSMGVATVGLVIVAPAIWMGFVNIYKRVSAFTYQNTVLYSVLISVLQIINQFMEDPVKAIITVGLVIVGLYLIFANSEIEDHQG